MDTIRTLIADDERPARARLRELLAREPRVDLIGEASSGQQAVELIQSCAPALLFLDIQMPDMDGFGVLQAVPAERVPVTVFVTAYDRYAIQAFEAHAVDYLLKPYSDQRFEAAFQHVADLIRSRRLDEVEHRMIALLEQRSDAWRPGVWLERLALKAAGRIQFIDVAEIDWLEACGVYVTLHIGTRTHLYRSSLTHLLQRLNPAQFLRVHRSAAVNTSRIVELRPRSHGDYTIVMRSGSDVVLSRSYRGQIERWLGQSI